MAWSTPEIADIAGTTVNTVRHYHQIGLLDEPNRKSNGYKQYQVAHLTRLLAIRRLRNIGVPLDQIASAAESEAAMSSALSTVDAELTASIQQLRQAQNDLRDLMTGLVASAGSEECAHVDRCSTEAHALVLICSQLFNAREMTDVSRTIHFEFGDTGAAFDALNADTDLSTRERLAATYARAVQHLLGKYPRLKQPALRASHRGHITERVVIEEMTDLCNPAQLDVLARAGLITSESLGFVEYRQHWVLAS